MLLGREPAEAHADGAFGLAVAAVGLDQRLFMPGSRPVSAMPMTWAATGPVGSRAIGGDVGGFGRGERIVDDRQIVGRHYSETSAAIWS